MEEYGNNRKWYGTIASGNVKCGRNVLFDDVTEKYKQFYIKRRNMLSVIDPD